MNAPDNLNEKATALHELLGSQRTLLLATASANGTPDQSYAPFVRDQSGGFYIFVSTMAAHTLNFLANPKASVMFIRQESESRNLFARERVVFNCAVSEIGRDDPRYTAQLDALQARFGEVISLLRSLDDFHLFALHPQSGRYVAGFGQAYTINIHDNSLSPIGSNKQN